MNNVTMSLKSKWAKTLVIGVCATFLMTGTAFAADGGGVAGSQGGAARAAVDSTFRTDVIDDATLQLQREIDEYLFVTHREELAKQAFKITHTSPLGNGVVEIGITPFEDRHAEYLYGIFGEKIRVVKGEQAYTLMAPDTPVSHTVDPVAPGVDIAPAGPARDLPAGIEPAPYVPEPYRPESSMGITVVGQEPVADGEMGITVVGQEPAADGDMSITVVGQEPAADGELAITSDDAGSSAGADNGEADTATNLLKSDATAAASQSNSLLLASAIAAIAAAIAIIAFVARKTKVAKAKA